MLIEFFFCSISPFGDSNHQLRFDIELFKARIPNNIK